MKNFKTLFLYTLLVLIGCNGRSWAQANTLEPEGRDAVIMYVQNPDRILPTTAVSLRFAHDALAYLAWEALPGLTGDYQVRYKPNDTSTEWTEVSTATPELLIDKLHLDVDYVWEVRAAVGEEMITSGRTALSTFAQSEPIQVSEALFLPLSGWFAQKENQRSFCDFIDGLPAHPLEKLAFLQAYSFDNAPLSKATDFKHLSDWYPLAYRGVDCTGFSTEKDRGDEIATECRCRVITRGQALPSPFEAIDGGMIIPEEESYTVESDDDRTYVVRLKAGAAKYIAFRQDESGGSTDHSASNIQGADAAENTATNYSDIGFTLGCIKDGGFSTNLPEKCACSRPLDVSYNYTTKLHVKARKKGCIWSKGAAGQAEDYAYLTVLNIGTGELTPVDAGHAVIGKSCNSSWNPEFWVNSLAMLRPVVDYYLTTLEEEGDSEDEEEGPVLPTEDQLDTFWEAFQDVLATPFSNISGDCADVPLVEEQVLINGLEKLILNPNQPLLITLYSNHYVRTRGFGCYEAEASIASDYRLVGVVQTTSASRECCNDKFASYIYGSLSAPSYSSIENNAVNNLNVRRFQVGNFLGLYGDWYDLSPSPTGGVDIEGELGQIYGPDCYWSGDQQGQGLQSFPDANPGGQSQVYPTSASDFVNVRIPNATLTGARLRVINAQGRELHRQLLVDGGATQLQTTIDVGSWAAGTYWVEIVNGDVLETLPFIKI